jgi:cytochrome c-type biogenesis protein CcmI
LPSYLAAATLVVVALLLLLRPWWRRDRRSASADSQATLNVAIHRDRLAELERDHRNGTLSDTGLTEAREELQRQLLEDTATAESVATERPTARRDSPCGLTPGAGRRNLFAAWHSDRRAPGSGTEPARVGRHGAINGSAGTEAGTKSG